MATDKKSFLLYCDLLHTVEKMPNDKAGELFKHILAYVNDLNPETDDLIIQLTFEPIKQQLKRDLKKYEIIRERNKENGKKGGRPKKPKKPSGLIGNPDKPKKADSDNDSVTVNDNEILLKREPKENIYIRFDHLSLSNDEFEKLSSDFTKEQIDSVLMDIENYSGNKKYKSLYLTALKWLKKNKQEQPQNIDPANHKIDMAF